MLNLSSLLLRAIFTILLAAEIVIAWAEVKLAHIASEQADRTGLGEVIAGAYFVGMRTSLPGAITSILTAAQGFQFFAIGKASGEWVGLGRIGFESTLLLYADSVVLVFI